MNADEVDYDVEMSAPASIPNKLYLFGVSSLSTKDIVSLVTSMFQEVPEIKVEWIDDSSCNVVLPDESCVLYILSIGTPTEVAGSVSLSCPSTSEGGEPLVLTARGATELDVKNPKRSWKESQYYRKRLESQGINPDTLRPVSKVILKPREGARAHSPRNKVTLIPRKLIHQAKSAIYGADAFSRKKERSLKRADSAKVVEEMELTRRAERAKRFAAHN
jgi:hypothetical protein